MGDKLDKKEYFNMAVGGKLIAKVPLSWKKSFSMGVVIPHKVKNVLIVEKIFYVMIVIT